MAPIEKASPLLAGGRRETCFRKKEHRSSCRLLPIPPATRKRYEALLHQQFWCLGADVRSGSPNLLERHGFEKRRPPQNHDGQSMYVKALDAEQELSLWGFGCVLRHREHGKLYLSRYSLAPLYCQSPKPMRDVWLPSEFPAAFRVDVPREECCAAMLLDMVAWFGAYERWAVQTIGIEQRSEQLAPWRDKIVCQAGEMAMWWEELAARLRPG